MMEPTRDSHGRFKADHQFRNRTVGAALIGGAAIVIGALFRGRRATARTVSDAEHPVPDLSAGAPTPGTNRAPDAFRPDPTAAVPQSEREALRPPPGFPTATGSFDGR